MARQRRAAEALGATGAVVLVAAGVPIHKPGGDDQTYPFLPHPAYYWLTGCRRQAGVMAWDGRGSWTHFVEPVTNRERLWEGNPEVPDGEDLASLGSWLKAREGEPVAVVGGRVPEVEGDATLSARASDAIDRARRPKDDAEIELMRRAIRATAAGHACAAEFIRPGVSEREIAIELETAMYRAGADDLGYASIVGTGKNAAVLHFTPGERRVHAGEGVLIDAGGSVLGYTADVTRTYPCGSFDPRQRDIYDIVLAAQHAAFPLCRAGTPWRNVHRATAVAIAEGLRDLKLLRGDLDHLVDDGAVALFYPHGVGHMVGLGVRDAGGNVLEGREPEAVCGVKLRMDIPVRAGFIMTVEPGLYFVDAILDDPERRAAFADEVCWDALEPFRDLGGVRLEDNVLIGDGEVEVLTAEIPK